MTSLVTARWGATVVAIGLAMSGAPTTRPYGFISKPTLWARCRSHVDDAAPERIAISVTERYGMWPMGLTSSPKKMSRMVELPTT